MLFQHGIIASNFSTKENEWMNSEKKDSVQTQNTDVENQDDTTNNGEVDEERLLPECDGLWYMGQSKKHRYCFGIVYSHLLYIFILCLKGTYQLV